MTDRDQSASNLCSICGTGHDQQQLNRTEALIYCAVCGWPYSPQMAPATELEVAYERWARQAWERLNARTHNDQQLEYLTQNLEWLVDRTHEIAQIQFADRFDQLEARLDAAIATHSFHSDPAPDTDDELPLYSELGLDYNPLALALSQADWRTADALTIELIQTAIAHNRPTNTEPTPQFLATNANLNTILDDIARFPATDLHTIAWAWAAYSEGRFGLVAQMSQWTGDYATFCDHVGWRNARGWLYYDELRFEPGTWESVPIGHFPATSWRKRACYGLGGETAASIMQAWFDRWQQITDPDETRSELDG